MKSRRPPVPFRNLLPYFPKSYSSSLSLSAKIDVLKRHGIRDDVLVQFMKLLSKHHRVEVDDDDGGVEEGNQGNQGVDRHPSSMFSLEQATTGMERKFHVEMKKLSSLYHRRHARLVSRFGFAERGVGYASSFAQQEGHAGKYDDDNHDDDTRDDDTREDNRDDNLAARQSALKSMGIAGAGAAAAAAGESQRRTVFFESTTTTWIFTLQKK